MMTSNPGSRDESGRRRPREPTPRVTFRLLGFDTHHRDNVGIRMARAALSLSGPIGLEREGFLMTSGAHDTGLITRTPGTETAVLAGGCFWGMEDLIRRQPGIVGTRVGYTGGSNDHPTYRHHPGHAEAVEIVFDPTQTTYRDVLAFFFQIHDPSTLNRQGNDIGASYRSAIFPLSAEQERVARDTIADV